MEATAFLKVGQNEEGESLSLNVALDALESNFNFSMEQKINFQVDTTGIDSGITSLGG